MASLEWTLRSSTRVGVVLAELRGAIDGNTVNELRRLFESLRGRPAIFDFKDVKYCNSAGLGFLVRVSDELRTQGGRLVLIRMPAKGKIVIEMLGLNAFFDVVADEAAALRILGVAAGPSLGLPVDDARVRVTDQH